MIDPRCRNIIKLFVQSLKDGGNNPTIDSFNKHYMSVVEIKDFNVSINIKPFFKQPMKNKQEAYKNC